MKSKILLTLFVFTFLTSCKHEVKDVVRTIDPVPDDLVPIELCTTLYANIYSLFPQGKNHKLKYPLLFDNTYEQRIILTKDTEVYVTFVGDGASRNNSLGWYSYNTNGQVKVNSNIRDQIVFPFISYNVLKEGDTRQVSIGKFKAGTVIGFFLITGGWNNEDMFIDFTQNKLYTDSVLNTDHTKQHVLFKEKTCNDLIIGFEDTRLSISDYDFNDILFKVSDNNQQRPATSFNTDNIPSL
ncbi:DUF4114 domain-containing protein [Chryseosolibacter indicus]|uniref:DUF4114 domain-containing protein n=1 Tax=Chryseosolibacter indicus TaxID=2782351 RepID=A0ABS5VYP9_9BACT|nr:DUF4114 domain-containing protein [Chryseosolibacter indicus]MBT1706178.1 DUF4114 domain-containing protein [Chryseosolibacter indicus]